MVNLLKFINSDPRILQILLMSTLLSIGILFRDFSISYLQIFLCFSSAFITQFLWTKLLKLDVSYFSTFITSLGLSLLLRSDSNYLHPVIAILAISSKFLFRINQKHIFNPAMLGVLIAIYLFPNSWVSPGQWGFEFSVSFYLLLFGLIIIGRAKIAETSYAFFLFYSLFLLYRIYKFGYSIEVFFHQFQSGSFLLFTFFMISDPKTMPNHKIARIFFAFIVALIAYNWSFSFFKTNSFIHALFFSAPIVIIFDKLFKSEKYKWGKVHSVAS
jgi:Na+-transporting NADH:ubiquinone oxidoreductase subunit NqrB